MKKHGLVQCYTGDGKGKTTSAFGLVFRAVAQDWNILIVQFLKGDTAFKYGEIKTCKKFADNITIKQFGRNKIVLATNIDDGDRDDANKAWNYLRKQKLEQYDMIVLDEVLVALSLGLITEAAFFDFVNWTKDNKIELVVTGRMHNKTIKYKVYDVCDLVSKIEPIKHYFNKRCNKCNQSFEHYDYTHCPYCGSELETVPARQGIEF